jgi:hypothetical protein
MSIKKVAFEFDPFEETGIEVRRGRREEALAEIAEFVKTETLSFVGDGVSPVAGGKWKKSLSPEYKKIKKDVSGVSYANLELYGDMLDALEVVPKGRKKLSIQITGDQAGKADGNNRGTYGKKDEDPDQAREFIPKEGQTFKREIWSGIRDILENYAEDDTSE